MVESLKIKTSAESRMIRARNLVGRHYDRLGKHDGWIWNGADDNASGTVGVMMRK